MKTTWKPTVGGALLLLATLPGHADTSIDQYLTFSGFGTLGAVYSDYRQADFTGEYLQPRGAGFSHSVTATPDSDLAGQADLRIVDGLTGVVQVISRDNAEGNFAPRVEWANLKYAFTPDLAVRVGRTLLPTYERSDSQNVGYALPWVRIPNEIRYSNTATHSDGVDVLYRFRTGSVTQDLQVQFGRTSEDFSGAIFRGKDLVVLSDTLQYGSTSVHLAYQTMMYTFATRPPARFRLASAGFTYDPGTWFVTGDSNVAHYDFFGDFYAWYLSVGMRFGQFTPYLIYSIENAPDSAPPAGLTRLGDERTTAAGVRWDFAKNVDFKLQLQRVAIDTRHEPASFILVQPGLQVGDKANVVSLTLDFVF
jgi:hypothetical protein